MRSSILNRLERLEKEYRFVNWFLGQRFIESLTDDELEAYAHEGKFPEPVPNRLSKLDGLDRDRLVKRWQEDRRIYEYRTSDDLRRFCEQGRWPEELGTLVYSNTNGGLRVEWRLNPEEMGDGLACEPRKDGPASEICEPERC
jgi:hypothetical protein